MKLLIIALLFGGALSIAPTHGNNFTNSSINDLTKDGWLDDLQNNIKQTLDEIALTARTIENAIGDEVKNFVLQQEALFMQIDKLLDGYPLKYAKKALNAICSALIKADASILREDIDLDTIKFQFFTRCKNYSYPVLRAADLLQNPEFDPKKKLIIFSTGWMTTIIDWHSLGHVWRAFLCREDVNFIAVDAATHLVTLYSWSALFTETIGKAVAEGLEKLSGNVALENIHLVGHSLGAHIMGVAGRQFSQITGKQIPRITGLDPAEPCFYDRDEMRGLQIGDADFIDIIHSNSGVLGKREPIGNVDFYTDAYSHLPPGCEYISCAHCRAVVYFCESVILGNENNFPSHKCETVEHIKNNSCQQSDTYMGYGVDRKARGIYFVNVRAEMPYGTNAKHKNFTECGLCLNKTVES